MMKYKWEPTGIGKIDNLGQQFAKVIRGTRQGSIETKHRYVEAGQRFVHHIGEKYGLQKIQNISDKHLASYAQHLKSLGRADKYIKTELAGIRYLHRQIPQARFELADAKQFNKAMGLGSTPDGRSDRTWTNREIKEMKNMAIELNRTEIKQALEAGRTTGMRLDEMASLRRNQVESALRTGKLHLTNTKGGRPRDIPLSDRARECLSNAIKDVPRGGYVFTPKGTKVHEFKAQIEDFIYNHRDKIQEVDRAHTGHNLSKDDKGALTYHGLRHSFAREFLQEKYQENLEKGMSEKVAEEFARQETAEVLGHGRVSVTYIYAPSL